ncbi:hypothetical protein [Chondromyces crocatus]|uniref:Uncharacterized protein n=1 Tax=Chondromyces crocatus TaxID=52 RepID=A0A0K1EQ79_CHOCO|nr:hypothetical protein [Chondromyces crocatus]AKT43006.1 uncharacterized protein CMC5_072330 [Chondromyces crocatus]
MRRIRKDATKVWHNPEIHGSLHRGQPGGVLPRVAPSGEDRRTANQHRAALEALFAPRKDPEAPVESGTRVKTGREAPGRIVLSPPPQSDPHAVERQKLLGRVLTATGRPAISKATNDFLKAGHTFPQEQDVYLQLLEHTDEERIQEAIEALSGILAGELPKRRAVLESRLRRIEEFAEESRTRDAASRLRKHLGGSPSGRGKIGESVPASGASLQPIAGAPLPAGNGSSEAREEQ